MATASTISRAEPYDEYDAREHKDTFTCTASDPREGTPAKGDRDPQADNKPPDSSDPRPNDSRGGPPVAWNNRVSSPIIIKGWKTLRFT